MGMHRIGFLLGGLVVLVGSFFVTNWFLSNYEDSNWKFTDEASLTVAATAAGFRQSNDVTGNVDLLARIDKEKVRAAGWVVDFIGNGSPIALNAFTNGGNIATFYSDGPRADVTEKIIKPNPKANPNSAKNTQFNAIFSCTAGGKLFIVATTATKSYALLGPQPLLCP